MHDGKREEVREKTKQIRQKEHCNYKREKTQVFKLFLRVSMVFPSFLFLQNVVVLVSLLLIPLPSAIVTLTWDS